MAEVRLPRYTRPKNTKRGTAFFWEPPHWARPPAERHGRRCPVGATALGTELAPAIEKAQHLNEALDGWRRGDVASGPTVGTVEWLFAWYREQRKFKKNRPKTRNDYRKLMDAVCREPMRAGVFGERLAAKVTPEVADKLYERFEPKGARQALYMVQVCRAVWNLARRYHAATGIPKDENPFARMGVSYAAKNGNRPTSRAEYQAYCLQARELGYQSMATAAALSFELVQRVWDVFSIPDPDTPEAAGKPEERGILWEDYSPGSAIIVRQSKTGKRIKIPLTDTIDGERVGLYPELEEQLALSMRAGSTGVIVVEERSGKPYAHRRMSSVHRKICNAANLPQAMTFTGFRHGGATEIGDAGEVDIRPLSGHSKLDTTAIYNKVSEEKARRIAKRRREHIAEIAGSNDQPDD